MKAQRIIFTGALLGLLGFAADVTSAQGRRNHLIQVLESGKPAIGVWTGALAATRIAKVVATSDVDFIVADVEHDVYDFPTLQRFLLQVQDFSHRFRTQPREAPAVLVKLGHRGGWEPSYEIAETLKIGPALGVWIPVVESRRELERAIAAVHHAETSLGAGLNLPYDQVDVWPLNPKGEMFVVAMIETPEGVRNAQEIVETPGVGAIHTVHISEADAAKVLKLCLDRKVIAAADANPTNAKAKLDAGYRLLSLGWDFGMLQRQLNENIKGVRGAAATGTSTRP
ncbi:MAG: hypothetical protein HYX76_02820 [Acidobacteria bacterium]|nr:hypothetical protein [Acidobacteriota bacterium]